MQLLPHSSNVHRMSVRLQQTTKPGTFLLPSLIMDLFNNISKAQWTALLAIGGPECLPYSSSTNRMSRDCFTNVSLSHRPKIIQVSAQLISNHFMSPCTIPETNLPSNTYTSSQPTVTIEVEGSRRYCSSGAIFSGYSGSRTALYRSSTLLTMNSTCPS